MININSLEYAYIGDAVYEIYIRKYMIDKGIKKVKNLQLESKKYVSAVNQSKYMYDMLATNFFNDNELDIIYRARNCKTNSKPKNTDIITYRMATSLEAIVGYLYLENNIKRINEIMDRILEDKEYVCTW